MSREPITLARIAGGMAVQKGVDATDGHLQIIFDGIDFLEINVDIIIIEIAAVVVDASLSIDDNLNKKIKNKITDHNQDLDRREGGLLTDDCQKRSVFATVLT
jgi:hypothetical protein